MNPYYKMQNVPMIMSFNFNKNLYGMNNFNPMWNMNSFGLLDQMNIMKQNMGMLNIQGGNSKPKSEPITLIFKKKKSDSIFIIETSSDESMSSVVTKYIEKSGDNNVNRYISHGRIIPQIFTIEENGLKNNDLIEVVRLKYSELVAL